MGRVERHRLLQRGDRRADGALRRLHRYRLRGGGPRAGCRAASRRGAPGHGGAAHRLGRPASACFRPMRSIRPSGSSSGVAPVAGSRPSPACHPTNRGSAQIRGGRGRLVRRRWRCFTWLGRRRRRQRSRPRSPAKSRRSSVVIGLRELRDARDALTSAEAAQPGTRIGAVVVGNATCLGHGAARDRDAPRRQARRCRRRAAGLDRPRHPGRR